MKRRKGKEGEREREGRGTRRKKRPRMRKKRRKKGKRRNVRKSGEAGLGTYLSIRMCISSHAILGYMRHYKKKGRKKRNQLLNFSHGHPIPYILYSL